MIICGVEAVVGWFVLGFIGTNVLGIVVRGLFHPLVGAETSDPFLATQIAKAQRTSMALSVFVAVVAVLYLYLLARFWNVWLAIAGALLMLARLPDLQWELRTGRKVTHKAAPKSAAGMLGTLAMWGALALIWFALCQRG